MPRLPSLKRRLLVVLVATVAGVWLATAAYTYFEARHEIDEMLDAHLAQSAALIVAQVGNELQEIDLEHAPQLSRRSRRVSFQIWEEGKILRLHSLNAPSDKLSAKNDGFSDATLDGRDWRVFSAWDEEHRYLVQVGEQAKTRREVAATVATSLLSPLALALPALALFIWFSILRALTPLTALSRQVGARRPEDLTPLAVAGAPLEVSPLVQNLNALFERVSRLIENERRFTADAAHELRTPLAALKTQAQVAQAATSAEQRRHALEQVLAGCDRATRLIEQMLTLARLEPGASLGDARRLDLAALTRQVLAELAPAALARDIEVELDAPTAAAIDGHADLVAVLLRNLIDNAIRYSAPGGRVRVGIAVGARADSRCLLTVADEGPGIPVEERDKVGRRFYRILGSGASGSGLGLSIVERIATIHGAGFTLSDGPAGKGLLVSVAFPEARST